MKEMVDIDIDNLMWELEADADDDELPDELRDTQTTMSCQMS